MGLITPQAQPAQAQPAQQAQGSITDPTLQAVEQQIMQQVPQTIQQNFQAIVMAGMKIMFSPQSTNLMQQRVSQSVQSKNQPAAFGDVIGRLMVLIYNESGGKVQLEAAIPAAIVLLCHILDYAEKTKQVQIDNNFVAQATQATIASTLKYFKVSPQMLAQASQQAQGSQSSGSAQPAQPIGGQ